MRNEFRRLNEDCDGKYSVVLCILVVFSGAMSRSGPGLCGMKPTTGVIFFYSERSIDFGKKGKMNQTESCKARARACCMSCTWPTARVLAAARAR